MLENLSTSSFVGYNRYWYGCDQNTRFALRIQSSMPFTSASSLLRFGDPSYDLYVSMTQSVDCCSSGGRALLGKFRILTLPDFIDRRAGLYLILALLFLQNMCPRDIPRRMVSRKYDFTSMGCFYLQFVTWRLEGSAGLEQFTDARMEINDLDDVEDDVFFTQLLSKNKAKGA